MASFTWNDAVGSWDDQTGSWDGLDSHFTAGSTDSTTRGNTLGRLSVLKYRVSGDPARHGAIKYRAYDTGAYDRTIVRIFTTAISGTTGGFTAEGKNSVAYWGTNHGRLFIHGEWAPYERRIAQWGMRFPSEWFLSTEQHPSWSAEALFPASIDLTVHESAQIDDWFGASSWSADWILTIPVGDIEWAAAAELGSQWDLDEIVADWNLKAKFEATWGLANGHILTGWSPEITSGASWDLSISPGLHWNAEANLTCEWLAFLDIKDGICLSADGLAPELEEEEEFFEEDNGPIVTVLTNNLVW